MSGECNHCGGEHSCDEMVWCSEQVVSAIRDHTRAMVVMKYRAFFNDAPISKVIGIADDLLAVLSASSGGEHGGAGIPGGGKPEHAAGPGNELTATPPLSADLVTVRRDDLAWVVAVLSIHGECTTRWNRLRDVVSR